jgi:small nuclear ribonucleoprotein (snRNP)-like protein
VNPKPFLNSLMGTSVIVKLKWSQEYKGEYARRLLSSCSGNSNSATAARLRVPHSAAAGRLDSTDAYMNIQLSNTEECVLLRLPLHASNPLVQDHRRGGARQHRRGPHSVQPPLHVHSTV